MAPLDPTVATLIDNTLAKNTSSPSHSRTSSLDSAALLSALDDASDPTQSAYRASRMQQLSDELTQLKTRRSQADHDGGGSYTTLRDEKTLLDLTTSTPRCVVHFCKADFASCAVMDAHLARLAARHYEARFVRVAVEDAPFVVERLGVRVLPCVMGFVDGVGVERIVGFEGLGYSAGDVKTGDLEARLLGKGVLVRAKVGEEDEEREEDGGAKTRTRIRSRGRRRRGGGEDEDSDDDDD